MMKAESMMKKEQSIITLQKLPTKLLKNASQQATSLSAKKFSDTHSASGDTSRNPHSANKTLVAKDVEKRFIIQMKETEKLVKETQRMCMSSLSPEQEEQVAKMLTIQIEQLKTVQLDQKLEAT